MAREALDPKSQYSLNVKGTSSRRSHSQSRGTLKGSGIVNSASVDEIALNAKYASNSIDYADRHNSASNENKRQQSSDPAGSQTSSFSHQADPKLKHYVSKVKLNPNTLFKSINLIEPV